MCQCMDDKQMKAAGRVHGPLFHTFVCFKSFFPARNKPCHWPPSSTAGPLRSQTHTPCQPPWSNHAALAPYCSKIHCCLIHEWRCWTSEAHGLFKLLRSGDGGNWFHTGSVTDAQTLTHSDGLCWQRWSDAFFSDTKNLYSFWPTKIGNMDLM